MIYYLKILIINDVLIAHFIRVLGFLDTLLPAIAYPSSSGTVLHPTAFTGLLCKTNVATVIKVI